MNPLRWDVLLVGFVLALPVLALGLRGDLSTEEMMTRVLWCLGAGWVVVGVLRFATTPPPAAKTSKTAAHPASEPHGTGDAFPAA
ncbi:hypothetical protein [Blastococcus brunescens]|uniref:Uncharacterized protein n=1 Tax=Blastococcus brunescens TaxID=1564165 RepID=A0ABZ1B1T5_9ACTN|nr:hypothetical protein [Blastococcus sp. BMG 8361]WRL64767.1 hypothetical protein U6N30_03090 [Blastococcus sp. BMG 8361]